MSWAKLDDRFWSHPKVQQAWRTHPRAIGLHCMAITWCAQHETDGVVADGFLDMVLAGFPPKDRRGCITALTSAGLWEEHDGGWLIHDYLEFNESRADADARRRKDSERKRRRNPDGLHAESERSPNGSQPDSGGIPSDPSRAPAFDPTRPDPTHPSTTAAEDREDVDRLCSLLAELMVANDPKAKVAPDGKRWRDAARLLLDQDGRSLDEAERVIRFSQADDFWRANVLSMPTLREKFPQLLLKMRQRPNGRAGISASDQAAEWLRGVA